MMGTRTPNLSSVSTILGTAAAAASVLTVTRTSSDPACASAMVWLTVDWTSAVSVLVMDWTTMGWSPPTQTLPILTGTEARRVIAGMNPHCSVEPAVDRLTSGLAGYLTLHRFSPQVDYRFRNGVRPELSCRLRDSRRSNGARLRGLGDSHFAGDDSPTLTA